MDPQPLKSFKKEKLLLSTPNKKAQDIIFLGINIFLKC